MLPRRVEMSITIGQSELETIASRVAGLAAVVPSGGVHKCDGNKRCGEASR